MKPVGQGAQMGIFLWAAAAVVAFGGGASISPVVGRRPASSIAGLTRRLSSHGVRHHIPPPLSDTCTIYSTVDTTRI